MRVNACTKDRRGLIVDGLLAQLVVHKHSVTLLDWESTRDRQLKHYARRNRASERMYERLSRSAVDE